MEEQQVRQEIVEATVQFENADGLSSSSNNPSSHFRFRTVPQLELNGFDQVQHSIHAIHQECSDIVDYALTTNDFTMFQQVLWLIKAQDDEHTRKALIIEYIRVCCRMTNEALNDIVDHLLVYLHQDIHSHWQYDINFLFDLLHNAGVNVEKFIELFSNIKVTDILNDVELKFKLNYHNRTTSHVSAGQLISAIKRVYRIVLSLAYFQTEKLNSTLTNDDHLFFFLLGFYLQLDKRFHEMNIIHLARRLMVNALSLLTSNYWNEKRDRLIECLHRFSSKNVYIVELFLKTNERSVRLRTRLALVHLKRLNQFNEDELRSEATMLDEIINHRLHPRYFERQVDFIDCVRLLGDIVDSYPYEQQIDYLSRLYEKIHPLATKTHERLLTDENHLLLFDDCARWETMLKPVLNEKDYKTIVERN